MRYLIVKRGIYVAAHDIRKQDLIDVKLGIIDEVIDIIDAKRFDAHDNEWVPLERRYQG